MLRSLKLKLLELNAAFPSYCPPQFEYGFASARQPHCPNGNEGGCMAAKGEERSISNSAMYAVNVALSRSLGSN